MVECPRARMADGGNTSGKERRTCMTNLIPRSATCAREATIIIERGRCPRSYGRKGLGNIR